MTAPASTTAPPRERLTDLTTFTVLAGGKALPQTVSVVSVEVAQAVDRLPAATVVVEDGDAAAQDFPLSASGLLAPGTALEVRGGYHSEEERLFVGVVTRHRVRVRPGGRSYLSVEARDPAFRMALAPRSRGFDDVDEADLYEALTRDYPGVSIRFADDAPPPARSHRHVTQYRTTDWDFLVARVERLGYHLLAEGGALTVARVDPAAEPALELAYGRDIVTFDGRLDVREQATSITVAAWDEEEQATAAAEVAPTGALAEAAGVAEVVGFGGAFDSEAELARWGAAAAQRRRLARFRGTVECQGTGLLRPGANVALAGLGARFDGAAFVAGVRHVLGLGDWTTIAQLGVDPAWHAERHGLYPAHAPGAYSPASGLRCGVVTQLAGDPAGRERIRVRLPLVDPPGEAGRWMRWASPQAGPGRGLALRPAIDDEVLVGFLDGDPDGGVVVGALFGGAHAAPVPPDDANPVGALVTAGGLRVSLDDDARALTLATPDGRRLALGDEAGAITLEDPAGNRVTLAGRDGLRLESAGDLDLSAAGKLTLAGASVRLEAQTSLTATGGTAAELSGGATLTLKGGLVRIN